MAKSSERDKERARLWYQNNKEKARRDRKLRYWLNPEKYRAYTKAYWDARKDEKREKDRIYKDKIRHAGRRLELIIQNGLHCSDCGSLEESINIVAHHISGKNDHGLQILLCRACHARLHNNQRAEVQNEGTLSING